MGLCLSLLGGIGGTIVAGFKTLDQLQEATDFNTQQMKVNEKQLEKNREIETVLHRIDRRQAIDSVNTAWIIQTLKK